MTDYERRTFGRQPQNNKEFVRRRIYAMTLQRKNE
jgi:hypothetical protein